MSKETLREILKKETCKELRERAKKNHISGRWDMTKTQLIDAILKAEVVKNTNELKGVKSAKDESKIDNQESIAAENKDEKKSANVEINMEQKMSYIENIKIGTLVAFRLSNGRVKSAKVIRKSTKNRKLKLETDYGAEYIVSFEDIIWVRTNKRWPRGVYNLLKGLGDDNGRNKKA